MPIDPTAPPVFVIRDHCKKPIATAAQMVRMAAALEIQVNRDAGAFRPYGWGFEADVEFVATTGPLAKDAIEIGLFDRPDQPGALGYHDTDPRGLPYIKVFPYLDDPDASGASVTISHEILEALGDPDGNTCAQSPIDGKIWALEICDAVEADTYEIDGIKVSNFVLPHYFMPPRDRRTAKYDFLMKVKAPYEIRPGGYGQYLTKDGWKQVYPPQGRRATFRLGHSERGYARLRHQAVSL